MTAELEFFFDLSSPWTRVAFANIQAVVAETGADIRYRPFLVGGVFNAVNDSVYAGRENPNNPKFRNTYKWLKEWASLAGVAMNFPSQHHPLKAVAAMRFCCALEDQPDNLFIFAAQAFEAYFAEQRNLDDFATLVEVADRCGLDGNAILALSQSDTVKTRLRANTQEAIDRGGFGSPMIYVNKKFMYFGNDQLPLVRQRIATESASHPECVA